MYYISAIFAESNNYKVIPSHDSHVTQHNTMSRVDFRQGFPKPLELIHYQPMTHTSLLFHDERLEDLRTNLSDPTV